MNAMSGGSSEWIEGPPLRPRTELLDWIERNARSEEGTRRWFRLPVVIRFEDKYQLSIESAVIGAAETDLDEDSIRLHLDDTGMSVSLRSRLRQYCPEKVVVCAVWLEGYWGRLVEVALPELGLGNRGKPFAVLNVVGAIQASEPVRPLVKSGP